MHVSARLRAATAVASSRRRALALPAPTGDDEDIVPLGTFKVTLARNRVDGAERGRIEDVADEVEEGTPEDIRRWLFPHLPSTNASLNSVIPTHPSPPAALPQATPSRTTLALPSLAYPSRPRSPRAYRPTSDYTTMRLPPRGRPTISMSRYCRRSRRRRLNEVRRQVC